MTSAPPVPSERGTPPRVRDLVAVAAWCGAVFGLLEGVQLNAARAWPQVLAPYKASAHQLWVAPAVDMILLMAAVPVVLLLLRLTRRWTAARATRLAVGVFVFAGALGAAATLRVLHPASSAVLALGLAVALSGPVAARASVVFRWLRRWVVAIPLALGLLAAGVTLWQARTERAVVQALPAAGVTP